MIEWDSIRFVVRFGVHVILGSIIFALVAATASLLHWYMGQVLDGTTTSPYIMAATEGVELLIFSLDLACVIAFVIKESLILLHSLWKDLRRTG